VTTRRRWRPATTAAWVLAAVAVGGAATLTVTATLMSRTVPGLVAYVGTFGTVVLAFALLIGAPALIGPCVAALAGAVALSLFGSGSALRVDAIAAGVLLYVVIEAAYWSFEWRRPLRVEPGILVRAILPIPVVALGAAAGGMALLTAAGFVDANGIAVEAVGALAALGVVAVVVGLARGRA